MPAAAVVALLRAAGFAAIVIDSKMSDIYWAQARRMLFRRAAERLASERSAICATKPQENGGFPEHISCA